MHRAPDAPGQRVPNETQAGVPVEDVVPPGVYVTDIADAEIGKTGRHRSDPRLASAMAQMSVLSRPKM